MTTIAEVYWSAYRAAMAADEAWSAALHERYGRNAGDARYDSRGTDGPYLYGLGAAKLAADVAVRKAWDRVCQAGGISAAAGVEV